MSKELEPMYDYRAKIDQYYKLLFEFDNDWCNKAYEVLKELNDLYNCATCPDTHIRRGARDMLHDISTRFEVPFLDFVSQTASIYVEIKNVIHEKDIYNYF